MKNLKTWAVGATAALLLLAGVTSTSAATVTVGVLPDTYAPTVLSETGDTAKVELGMKFSPTTDGRIKGIQFYQNASNSGVTSVSLWGNGGTRLIKLTIPATGPVGWRTIAVDRALTAGRTYTVSVSDTNGRYPYSPSYFTSERVENGITVGVNAGVYRYGATSEFPSQAWNGSNYLVDLVYETTVADPEPVPTPTPTPEPTPEPVPAQPTSSYNFLGRSFPDLASTGVPAGTALAPYTGPCTIQTAGYVIDSKEVRCEDLRIFAKDVIIRNSAIYNRVYVDPDARLGSFTITDSEVHLGDVAGTGIGDSDFTATRVEVTGGNRSINCYRNCLVQDSFVHGQFSDESGVYHESGIRINTNSTLRHNTILCDAPSFPPDAGCSAAITGYPDFDPVTNNTVEGNLILSGPDLGYCAYGGSTAGKPYSGQTHDIVYRDNIWQRGSTGKCGWFGPITAFDVNAPGNIWSNNLWEDGSPVAPAN